MSLPSYNPYDAWDRFDGIKHMVTLFHKDKPIISGGDTETTGLHLVKDKPFLIIFGWLIPGKTEGGRVFTFEPTKENMEIFLSLAKQTRMFIWQNTTYDLHMMENIDFSYNEPNLVENMVLARLSLEALSTRDGGDSMALKHLGTKYVHPHAAYSEAVVKEELKKLNQNRVNILTAALKEFDHPTETEYKPIRIDTGKKTTTPYANKNPDNVFWRTLKKKWNKGLVEDFLKDITNDLEDLPPDVREVWEAWQEEYPEATYQDVDPKIMKMYAGDDVITMLEFAKKALKIIKQREQGEILKRECAIIPAIRDMERYGLRVDREYLESCRIKLKNYIIRKRKEMYDLAGAIVNVGQDKTIIDVFKKNWNVNLVNCDKAVLKNIMNDELEGQMIPEGAKAYARLINQLRRLEKWYSTYIVRTLERSSFDGRLYLQLNQAGAVSGRFSSDGQQFPKDAILDDDGNELYHPRRAFIADEGMEWYFLDYSQIELRDQANYTILVSGGDLNLCRAYMPFKCTGTHKGTTGEYNYREPEKRRYWQLQNFWHDEKDELWTPTDVHGQTAHNALIELGYECKEMYDTYHYVGKGDGFFGNIIDGPKAFKKVRDKGKTFNFMRNYGGGVGAAMKQLNLPRFVAEALIAGYSTAFPGVETYQEKIQEQHHKKGYVQNMYGRRYYLSNMQKSYVLANYCVQGTCADLIKEAIAKIHNFLKKYKSKMIMTIHDELQFMVYPSERHIIPKIREIMEDHPWHLVPIVADIEMTTGAWVDKEDVA